MRKLSFLIPFLVLLIPFFIPVSCVAQITAPKGIYIGDSIAGSNIVLIDSFVLHVGDTAFYSRGRRVPAGGSGGGGGGASTFAGLDDTPSSYSGQGEKLVRVATGETVLEFSNTVDLDDATGVDLRSVDTVLYSNPESQTTMVTLPAAAVLWDIQIYVVTGFNGSGWDYLNIGITGSSTRYLATIDISSSGFKSLSPSNIPDYISGSTNITYEYDDQSTGDATQGEAYVYLLYSKQ